MSPPPSRHAREALSVVRRLAVRLSSGGFGTAALFAAALAVLSYQYATAMYHATDAPRGTGEYHPLVAVQDGHKMYLQAMSAVFDRDLDITDEVRDFGYPGFKWKTDDGRPIYPHAIGPILVWTPTLALAHGASKVANGFGADIPSHGYSVFHQRIVLYTSVFFAWLAAFLGYRSARRLLGDGWAAPAAAIAILFGTNLSYYAVQRPDYGHALSAATTALFLAYWIATFGDRRWRRFVWLGLLLGFAGLSRIANVSLGVVVAIEIAGGLLAAPAVGESRLRRDALSVARGALALGVAILALLPQMLVWKYHYEGGLLGPPHGDGYVHLGRPMLTEFLFSSHNGFLSTHPLAYASLGLLLLPRRVRLIGVALFAGVLLQAYVNSCVWDWWAMGSYGARRMCCVALALIVGLASTLRVGSRLLGAARVPVWPRRALGIAVLAWFVVWTQSYDEASRARRLPVPLAMCCDEVPEIMADLARPIYERVGNPFALPASLPWAWQNGVEVSRFDEVVVGDHPGRPKFTDFKEKRYRRLGFVWNIPGIHFDTWIAGGVGPRQRYRDEAAGKRRNYRWTIAERGEIFLPLFLASDHRLRIRILPNLGPGEAPVPVTIELNGEPLVTRELGPGWHTYEFVIPEAKMKRGTNLLGFRAPLRPVAPDLGLAGPADTPLLGVALGQLEIHIDDPRR